MKIERLNSENRELEGKIENSNAGIQNYISEMSTMLDSNDFMLDMASEDMNAPGYFENNEVPIITNSARENQNGATYDTNQ